MAYLLQPDLKRVENPALPPECANETIIVYPQPSNLNYCCRPNTMLYGTAPYRAGKGSPAEFIDVSDELRPQSTTQFGRVYVNNTSRAYFPIQNMQCSQPLRVISYEPASTRAEMQNSLFNRRYCHNK